MCYGNRPHYILAPRLLNKKRRLPPPPQTTNSRVGVAAADVGGAVVDE